MAPFQIMGVNIYLSIYLSWGALLRIF